VHRSRIDVIPAPFLTLLLELGISPKQLGVTHLQDSQLAAWESGSPQMRRRPATAHIERARLEGALAEAVERDPRIDIRTEGADWRTWQCDLTMDATGRAAASALCRNKSPRPWIAETFNGQISPSRALQAFRIAALPRGYAYRLGSGEKLTIGVIRWRGPSEAEEIEQEIRAEAAWLLQGVPPLSSMKRGRGGACALQWSEDSSAAVCIGDANIARDSLASQGIAIGCADALQLASGALTRAAWLMRTREQRQRHITALRATLDACRFKDLPPWAEYRHFLDECLPRIATESNEGDLERLGLTMA
jgi:2-polyprenyl-6-methoxyphenol hydroxylase-like FAD-dependent oxidoreductase